jgi:tetratricopeptide (TPR) repeat protein
MPGDPAKDSEAALRAGLYWRVQGDYENAIANLERAVALNPEFANAHRVLGQTLSYWAADTAEPRRREELLERAAEEVQLAIRLRETPAALHDLAWILDEKGDLEGAVDTYRRALQAGLAEEKESPQRDFTPLRYNLACSLAKLGQFEGAIDQLTPVFKDEWRGEVWRWAAKDPDFEPLRESEWGKRLTELIEAAQARSETDEEAKSEGSATPSAR